MDLFGSELFKEQKGSLQSFIQANILKFSPEIGDSWKKVLSFCFQEEKILDIKKIILHEIRNGEVVYPLMKDVFNAYKLTPFESVRVVILGQDPYHGKGQAHGLSFSVPVGQPIPASLQNIFKELVSDIGIDFPKTGNLFHWAKQGVLLLNTILTVRKSCPASHRNIGWEIFTDYTIKSLSESNEHSGIIFVLWGRYAQKKKVIIDQKKHFVLEAAHPSPFSAYNGFLGCKHFSKINELLLKQNKKPINWFELQE